MTTTEAKTPPPLPSVGDRVRVGSETATGESARARDEPPARPRRGGLREVFILVRPPPCRRLPGGPTSPSPPPPPVRYVGEVDGQRGQWVGVEWDDSTRGAHDGAVGGRRYFRLVGPYQPPPSAERLLPASTLDGEDEVENKHEKVAAIAVPPPPPPPAGGSAAPSGASLLKPSKLAPPLSLTVALARRYGAGDRRDAEGGEPEEEDLWVPTDRVEAGGGEAAAVGRPRASGVASASNSSGGKKSGACRGNSSV